MSLLTNATQANPTSFYFAVAGGGGGGGGTLQSPASVTPDETGIATLSVNADQATGLAAISSIGGANSAGVVTVGGFGSTYRMGVLAGTALPAPSLPSLQIGLNAATAPAISYDGGSHTLVLGDGNAASVVQTGGAFAVYDAAGGSANAVAISTSSATTGFIAQTCASAGTLALGSSTAYPSSLEVKDNGTQAYVVVGGNGANGVYLNGAAGNTTIVGTTATTNTNGNLQLQASSGATNTINITDTTVTVDQILTQQVPGTVTYSPAVPLGVATRGAGNYDFSIATYATGLYMLMVRVANANLTDNPTVGNMFSTLLYIQQQSTPGTSIVVGGGGGGSSAMYSTPLVTGSLGADSIRVVNNTGGNTYFSVKMLQIMGTLPGFNA
jgi:hypothetical protein